MTEMDQHGGISPSHLDDGSEKQQQSYHSENEDIASLQDTWPSFNQDAPHALETPTSKAKTENVNNGKGGLGSADASKLSDEAANQQNHGQAAQRHESGGSSGKRCSKWDLIPEEGGAANEGECSGKKKRSRWGTEEPNISMPGVANESECSGDKRSRWADPEVQELCRKLVNINTRLQTGNVIVESGDGQRSPSPAPEYNSFGNRNNKREDRARNKLIQEKQVIIASLIEKNQPLLSDIPHISQSHLSSYKAKNTAPADSKPVKLRKKIYIPVNDYPGYNFIGLIIGPSGNTQKRMEQETGAKIVLRGRGSSKVKRDGSSKVKRDPSDNEDLHVLVEADDENSLEEACRMVEKLLVPVEEGRNEHKRAQLRELAGMNGTLKIGGCRLCGQLGHKQVACPKKVSLQRAKVDTTNDQDLCFELGTGKTAVSMEKSGSVIPRKSIQPLGSTDNYMSSLSQAGGLEHPQNGNAGIGPEVMRVSMETRGSELPIQSSQPPGFTDNYMSWLARGLEHLENGNAGIVPGKVSVEKGGSGLPRQSTQPVGLTDTYVSWLAGGLEQPEKVNAALVPQIRKASIEKSGSELTSQSTQSRGLTDNPGKEIDHSNVYVGYMPFTMDEEQLIKLFSSFGRIVKVVVIRDYANGSSKGYGFVKFCDSHCAAQAIAHMNGYRLEGKTLVVRVAGLAPSHSEVGSAECLYNFDKQPPGFPVHSGDYAQPSWSPLTRPVSSSSYNPYSDNNCSGIASHSVSSLQGGTFNSLPATDNHGKEIDHSDVYVGNMPPTMDEEQLIKLFSSFGRIVKVNVIRDYVKGSCKGYCFVKFCDNHCAAQAIAHMNGYRLEGQNLVVRVAGLAPSHSQVGTAECLYNFDKQPPRLPVHSGDYAQPSWSPSIRPVSSSPYNPYSDNNCSGIASHSVSSLQGGTFNSLPATSYFPYGLYQMPLPSAESSSGMQGPPRSQQVQGNVHDSSMSKLNVHSADAMSHFSPNQARISTYHRYAPPSIPLGSAYSESPSRGSLMGGLGTLPRSSSLLSSGHEKKAVELEYERFLSEMGPRHENI